VRTIRNRALFEVIDVLAQVLQPAPVVLSGLAPTVAPAH